MQDFGEGRMLFGLRVEGLGFWGLGGLGVYGVGFESEVRSLAIAAAVELRWILSLWLRLEGCIEEPWPRSIGRRKEAHQQQ